MAKNPTPKQLQFVEQYVSNGGNATQAALAVYDTRDYVTAQSIGYENLRKSQIRAEIAHRMQKVSLRIDSVLLTLKEALSADIAKSTP